MGCAVIKRIKRLLEETLDTLSGNPSTDFIPQERKEPSFVEGLSKSSIRIKCSNNKKCDQCYNGTSHTL